MKFKMLNLFGYGLFLKFKLGLSGFISRAIFQELSIYYNLIFDLF